MAGGGGGGCGDHEHHPVERIDDGMGWLLQLLLLLGAQGRCRCADLSTPDLPRANPRLPAWIGGGGEGRRRGLGRGWVKGRLHMVRGGKDLILSILQLPRHTGSLFFLPLISILLCAYYVVLDCLLLALNINECHYGSRE